MSLVRLSLLGALLSASLVRFCDGQALSADLLLWGGNIVDGSGGAPSEGSVAVRDGKILAIGELGNVAANRTINCQGLVICPGFIDLHNHSDHTILSDETRGAICYLTQGCTTLVTGNCGGGRADVGRFYDELVDEDVGINIAHLVPHGSLREKVIGNVRRAPTAAELDEMKRLAAKGMEEGGWGMSTGLQYVPSAYADTAELVAMSREIARYGGIYASHIRDESDELLEAIEEVIQIAHEAGLRCHISHLKATKRRNWGKVRAAARIVEEARKRGLKITADQYPYTASSTSIMAMLLPEEEREGGQKATAARLKDPEQAARLRPIIAEALEARGELMIASYRPKPGWVGKMIREVAGEEGRDTVDIAVELLRDGDPQGLNFGMDEADVRYVMSLPWVATASDGSSKIDDGTRPHPRSFGTFPRKIGRYAIQEQVVSLPAAVRSATGLPADILGMTDRGYIREHLVADLVVFDPKQLEDRATYQEPFETSVGVRWVILNGEIAIADGAPQKVLAGRPLRRTSHVPGDPP